MLNPFWRCVAISLAVSALGSEHYDSLDAVQVEIHPNRHKHSSLAASKTKHVTPQNCNRDEITTPNQDGDGSYTAPSNEIPYINGWCTEWSQGQGRDSAQNPKMLYWYNFAPSYSLPWKRKRTDCNECSDEDRQYPEARQWCQDWCLANAHICKAYNLFWESNVGVPLRRCYIYAYARGPVHDTARISWSTRTEENNIEHQNKHWTWHEEGWWGQADATNGDPEEPIEPNNVVIASSCPGCIAECWALPQSCRPTTTTTTTTTACNPLPITDDVIVNIAPQGDGVWTPQANRLPHVNGWCRQWSQAAGYDTNHDPKIQYYYNFAPSYDSFRGRNSDCNGCSDEERDFPQARQWCREWCLANSHICKAYGLFWESNIGSPLRRCYMYAYERGVIVDTPQVPWSTLTTATNVDAQQKQWVFHEEGWWGMYDLTDDPDQQLQTDDDVMGTICPSCIAECWVVNHKCRPGVHLGGN